jgi:hypothetical protein
MRTLWVAVALGILAASNSAFADSWRSKAALDSDAPTLCRQADVSMLEFVFTDSGNELSGKTNNGHDFSAPIATDGSVSTTITVPVDGKDFVVDLTGNARSRDLRVFNKKYACRFTLTPVQ